MEGSRKKHAGIYDPSGEEQDVAARRRANGKVTSISETGMTTCWVGSAGR